MDYNKIAKLAEVFEKKAQDNMTIHHTDEQLMAGIQGVVLPAIGVDTNMYPPDSTKFVNDHLSPWLMNSSVPQKTDEEGYLVVDPPWGAKLVASQSGVKVIAVVGGKDVGDISSATMRAQRAAKGMEMPKSIITSWISKNDK